MYLQLNRQFFRTPVGIAILIVTGGVLLWALFVILRPLPGRDLAIAAGPPGSAYVQVAERYREILARHGVRLRLVQTNGAVENLDRLRDASAGVGAGFVQAGTTSEQQSPQLVSLGAVFYEPLWVFCACHNFAELLRDHPAARVSIGPVGSATRPLALQLLALVGADTQRLQLLDYRPDEAARRLIGGEIDVAILLAAWESPNVQQLLLAPVELIGFKRADAYVARDPNLSKLVLPEGVADLKANRPPADVPLIAAKASLVVRKDLHPALQYLLLHTAIEVHERPGIFQRAGEFPAPDIIDLPLSSEARHLYKSGPSILQRTLPFWLAELVQRLLIIILPVAGILYPLWSLLPRLYRWQMQRRVFRFYGELRLLETALGRCNDRDERERVMGRIEDLERRVFELKMPRSFSEMTLNLRRHIRTLHDGARAAA
jgi:TRAP-type uncharacterized transport system substrate-binding protein